MITNLNFVLTQIELTNLVHAHIRSRLNKDIASQVDGIEVTLEKVLNETRAVALVTLVNCETFFE